MKGFRVSKLLMSPANRGVVIGSVALFLSFLGATLTFPFLQSQRDKLGCDALCFGSMQSARSGLTMIGTVLIGRMSDRFGRSSMLWVGTFASIISYTINLNGGDITAMWISMVPSALFNQNFSVLKALFADYSAEFGYSESQRASAVGRLGMVVGLSFMVGPVLGASCLSSFEQATTAAIGLSLLSAVLLYFLPESKLKHTSSSSEFFSISTDRNFKGHMLEVGWVRGSLHSCWQSLMAFLYLPALQTPGAWLLMCMRCSMALAYHIFSTIWTVSLRSRFDFGPKGHAYFMAWIGLWYALSQGFLARESIRLSGDRPTRLLLVCVSILSFGRVAAMLTDSLVTVYVVMAAVIIALGVMNTVMASACSHVAGRDQVGGLYGVMESVESVAGLFGPAMGGLLYRSGAFLPLVGVVTIYAAVFVAVWLFYQAHVVDVYSAAINEPMASVDTDEKELCHGTTCQSAEAQSHGDGITYCDDTGSVKSEDSSCAAGSTDNSIDSSLLGSLSDLVNSVTTRSSCVAADSVTPAVACSKGRESPRSPDTVVAMRSINSVNLADKDFMNMNTTIGACSVVTKEDNTLHMGDEDKEKKEETAIEEIVCGSACTRLSDSSRDGGHARNASKADATVNRSRRVERVKAVSVLTQHRYQVLLPHQPLSECNECHQSLLSKKQQ